MLLSFRDELFKKCIKAYKEAGRVSSLNAPFEIRSLLSDAIQRNVTDSDISVDIVVISTTDRAVVSFPIPYPAESNLIDIYTISGSGSLGFSTGYAYRLHETAPVHCVPVGPVMRISRNINTDTFFVALYVRQRVSTNNKELIPNDFLY